MTEANDSRALGRVEGKLDALIETVTQSEAASSTSRKQVYGRLETISVQLALAEKGLQMADARLAAIEINEETLRTITRRLEAIEPFAKKAERWEQRGLGAIAAVGMIAGCVGAGLVYFKNKISAFLFGG